MPARAVPAPSSSTTPFPDPPSRREGRAVLSGFGTQRFTPGAALRPRNQSRAEVFHQPLAGPQRERAPELFPG